MRRSPKVAEVLPILYLRDFRPALEALLGDDAGLSPTAIARLTAGWEKEYTDFRQRNLSGREYIYVWVHGIHFNIRLDDDRFCTEVDPVSWSVFGRDAGGIDAEDTSPIPGRVSAADGRTSARGTVAERSGA
jgi:hypothetical protein